MQMRRIESQNKKRKLEQAILKGKPLGPNNQELGPISISALETGMDPRQTEAHDAKRDTEL